MEDHDPDKLSDEQLNALLDIQDDNLGLKNHTIANNQQTVDEKDYQLSAKFIQVRTLLSQDLT